MSLKRVPGPGALRCGVPPKTLLGFDYVLAPSLVNKFPGTRGGQRRARCDPAAPFPSEGTGDPKGKAPAGHLLSLQMDGGSLQVLLRPACGVSPRRFVYVERSCGDRDVNGCKEVVGSQVLAGTAFSDAGNALVPVPTTSHQDGWYQRQQKWPRSPQAVFLEESPFRPHPPQQFFTGSGGSLPWSVSDISCSFFIGEFEAALLL